MLLMGKSTILTGPFSSSQTVCLPEGNEIDIWSFLIPNIQLEVCLVISSDKARKVGDLKHDFSYFLTVCLQLCDLEDLSYTILFIPI